MIKKRMGCQGGVGVDAMCWCVLRERGCRKKKGEEQRPEENETMDLQTPSDPSKPDTQPPTCTEPKQKPNRTPRLDQTRLETTVAHTRQRNPSIHASIHDRRTKKQKKEPADPSQPRPRNQTPRKPPRSTPTINHAKTPSVAGLLSLLPRVT
ncbi:hypothetical protein BC831DRAFT_119405 [Entophlyctis helioformis]|nr:hypothetical protein BC831DRAFT_119405 [Entophlyctis helioformis]